MALVVTASPAALARWGLARIIGSSRGSPPTAVSAAMTAVVAVGYAIAAAAGAIGIFTAAKRPTLLT